MDRYRSVWFSNKFHYSPFKFSKNGSMELQQLIPPLTGSPPTSGKIRKYGITDEYQHDDAIEYYLPQSHKCCKLTKRSPILGMFDGHRGDCFSENIEK